MKGKKPLKDLKKDLLESVVLNTLKSKSTTTTLDIKNECRQKFSDIYWGQSEVSSIMNDMSSKGLLEYTDNGTYRTYSLKNSGKLVTPSKVMKVKSTPKASTGGKISRKKALELMKNNKGRFFTAIFIKKDNTTRIMNCAYMTGQTVSDLGYVKVKEVNQLKSGKRAIRNLNLQTLVELRIAGTTYNIK